MGVPVCMLINYLNIDVYNNSSYLKNVSGNLKKRFMIILMKLRLYLHFILTSESQSNVCCCSVVVVCVLKFLNVFRGSMHSIILSYSTKSDSGGYRQPQLMIT